MLTGGGDCPGLNAVMRAVVRKGRVHYGDEMLGIRDGWLGAVENQVMVLSVDTFRGTLPRGGTILGSSRTNPYKLDHGPERVKATLADNDIEALVTIGGEDTLGVAARLAEEGVAVVGVPKTIDNDLSATELTFGFDTAVQVCVDAIDRLHTTAESHHRVMVVEVMGRHAGHIALWAAIAGGATMVLVPERPFDIDDVCRVIQHRHEGGRWASIVVVAEGAQPAEGTMATRASMPCSASTRFTVSGPPSTLYGLVRDEPMIVPPRGRMPRTCGTPSSIVWPSSGPFQPSRKPTNSWP